MQIRLTVLAPRSGQTPARTCDVLVTAPAGTALAAVASSLAAAVTGPEGSQGGGAVVLYAGRDRLDPQRCSLGEPPLVDGAVLSLQLPGEDEAADDAVPARLHVIAGPDAGGVHLLHGGQIRIGRSTDADVPLDDPDVSRLHCAVTVSEDGRVSVADLGSTNGTSLDGTEIDGRPVRLAPGALLRLGESTLRLTTGTRTPTLTTAPDGEGHLRVNRADARSTRGAGPHEDAQETGGEGRAGGSHSRAYSPEPSRHDTHGGHAPYDGGPAGHDTHGGHGGHGPYDGGPAGHDEHRGGTDGRPQQASHGRGTHLAGGEPPRRGGIGAWARRLAGGKGEPETSEPAGTSPSPPSRLRHPRHPRGPGRIPPPCSSPRSAPAPGCGSATPRTRSPWSCAWARRSGPTCPPYRSPWGCGRPAPSGSPGPGRGCPDWPARRWRSSPRCTPPSTWRSC